MKGPGDTTFEALRRSVAEDLEPVRPSLVEKRLGTMIAVLGGLLFLGVGSTFGLRQDLQALGKIWAWGLTLVQFVAAFCLLRLTFRESSPGRYSSHGLLGLASVMVLILHLATTWITFHRSPLAVPTGEDLRYSLVCFALELALGLPLSLLALWFLERGIVTRPLTAAVLAGLGAGLVGDGVWRLICPYSEPIHVLTSHTAGVLGVSLLTLAVGAGWDVKRLKDWRARTSDP